MSVTPSTYESVPAPWELTAQGWWFIQVNSSCLDLTKGGYYHPAELDFLSLTPEKDGVFKGGLAIAQVYRYTESPVGPYDELIIVPGKYTNPLSKKEYLRISSIYVSTEASVYNGRKNWNIPKHLARFKFTEGPNGSTKIEIFRPNESTTNPKPFFSVISTPSSWIPSFPFRTSWAIQDLTIAQPPLHSFAASASEAEQHLVEGEDINALVDGGCEWKTVLPLMKGRLRMILLSPGLKSLNEGEHEYGDGVYAPKLKPWNIGLEWLSGMKMTFPEPGKIQTTAKKDITSKSE